MNVVRTLELCAGVGMLSEGIHAGLRHFGFTPRSVGYVERDAYAAATLLARMEAQALEPAPVWAGNLEDVRWQQWHGAVDCVAAGFPCQPHSMAGSRKGTDDTRWIWPAITECIRIVRPWLVVLENVSGLRSSGGMSAVLADLATLGFRVEWDSIRASDVGASHQRERVFIVAYSPELRRIQGRAEYLRAGSELAESCGNGGEAGASGAKSRQERVASFAFNCRDGFDVADTGRARRQQIAGSAHGDEEAHEGRRKEHHHQPASEGADMANPSQPRRQGRELRDSRNTDGGAGSTWINCRTL